MAGSASYSGGTYTVRGSGVDIWDATDQFQFVYRQFSGDVDVIARVTSVENVHAWTKAGVMIRESLTGNARNAFMLVSAANGLSYQRRTATGGLTVSTKTGSGAAPMWVKVSRRGNTVIGSWSFDGAAWTAVTSDTLTLPTTFYVGLAVTSHNNPTLASGVFDSVSVLSPTANQPPTVSITSPSSGASFTAPASITVNANAGDADGSVTKVDVFANGSLVGTDTTSPYSVAWNNVAAGSYSVTAVATDSTGATTTSGAVTVTVTNATTNQPPSSSLTAPAAGATYTAPASIAITAAASDSDGTVSKVDFFSNGSLIGTATTSPYSFTWSNVAAGTYSLTAVATDNAGATTTSAARSVTVNAATTGGGLPSGWSAADVGGPAVAGSTSYSGGTFTVRGAGIDVWDTSDQFQFASQPFSGDVDIVARVASIQNVNAWSKAGVMIRSTLTGSSANAFMLVSAANGLSFQRRLSNGAISVSTKVGSGAAPVWVKLSRRGTTVTGSWSTNGTTWTTVGSDSLTLPASFYVGLAVTSHDGTAAANGVFDSVAVSVPPSGGNQLPSVSLTAPASGATFTAPASVTVSADASDADGTIAKVDFYQGATLIGTDTSSPYSITWSNVPAGTYSIVAVATDNLNGSTTSSARSITVSGGTMPSRAKFTPSSNDATAVTTYRLDIYTAGSNPATSTPIATRDLGKPPVVNGECDVDVSSTIAALPAGNYQATVMAIGPGGQARSVASPSFTR